MTNSVETLQVSDSWKKKFTNIEKAGGTKIPDARQLSFGERLSVSFNILAFIFGPFYYAAKGMWRKALTLLGISIIIIVAVEVACRFMEIDSSFSNVIGPAIFSSRATIDFYKKTVLNDNGWW